MQPIPTPRWFLRPFPLHGAQRRSQALTTALLLASLVGGCVGEKVDEGPEEAALDKLRILGIQSEPADLIPGDTATLRSLVYAPGTPDIEYSWSWCPARGAAEDNFECALDEDTLQTLWDELGIDTEFPSFDLGDTPEVELENPLSTEVVEALCALLFDETAAADLALQSCLEGLELSIQLEVRAGSSSARALKEIPLRPEGTQAAERNQNPGPLGEPSIREFQGSQVGDGDTVRVGRTYIIEFDFGPELAEEYTSESADAVDSETLVMSWFAGPGFPGNFVEQEDPLAGDFSTARNVYVPGRNELEAITGNAWLIPNGSAGNEGVFISVLRDDRGGIAWSEQRFELEGGE